MCPSSEAQQVIARWGHLRPCSSKAPHGGGSYRGPRLVNDSGAFVDPRDVVSRKDWSTPFLMKRPRSFARWLLQCWKPPPPPSTPHVGSRFLTPTQARFWSLVTILGTLPCSDGPFVNMDCGPERSQWGSITNSQHRCYLSDRPVSLYQFLPSF